MIIDDSVGLGVNRGVGDGVFRGFDRKVDIYNVESM